MWTPDPSFEQRLASTAQALHPYHFVLDRNHAAGLRRYEPLADLPQPEYYLAGVFGTIEGVRVEGYEYAYGVTHRSSHSTIGTNHKFYPSVLVFAFHHPGVMGGASFAPDHPRWGGLAEMLDLLFWIPPFTLFKAYQLHIASRTPDREIGDAQFDRLFKVRAASNEAAAQVITPALRAAVLRLNLRTTVELRPGLMLYNLHHSYLDGPNVVHTIGAGLALLSALVTPGAQRAP